MAETISGMTMIANITTIILLKVRDTIKINKTLVTLLTKRIRAISDNKLRCKKLI